MIFRNRMAIYVGLLLLAVATMAILYFGVLRTSPRDYPEISREGVLRIVTEYNRSGYYLEGDKIEGFQYELSRAIAEVSGLEVQLSLEMSLEKSFEGLRNNRYDVIAQNIPTTTDLKEQYLFIDPVILNKQVLVQRTAAANGGIEPLRNQLDLAGKTLYVPANSPALLRLENLQHEIADTIHIVQDPLYSTEQLIAMVAKADIDFAVCDRRIAQLAQERMPEIDIRTDISFTQLQAWALRKESPVLRDSLNSWFRQIRSNGVYDRIYRTYYGNRP